MFITHRIGSDQNSYSYSYSIHTMQMSILFLSQQCILCTLWLFIHNLSSFLPPPTTHFGLDLDIICTILPTPPFFFFNHSPKYMDAPRINILLAKQTDHINEHQKMIIIPIGIIMIEIYIDSLDFFPKLPQDIAWYYLEYCIWNYVFLFHSNSRGILVLRRHREGLDDSTLPICHHPYKQKSGIGPHKYRSYVVIQHGVSYVCFENESLLLPSFCRGNCWCLCMFSCGSMHDVCNSGGRCRRRRHFHPHYHSTSSMVSYTERDVEESPSQQHLSWLFYFLCSI